MIKKTSAGVGLGHFSGATLAGSNLTLIGLWVDTGDSSGVGT